MFMLLALAVSAMLNIMALDLALLSDSIKTKLFWAIVNDAYKRELRLCGYFVIVTSEKMTAEEAIDLYYSRDTSEKLFRGDKSHLGNKSLRVYGNESADAKIFIEFVALIVRNRIYTSLKEELEKKDEKPNYMTVPAALKELEKIEMIRGWTGHTALIMQSQRHRKQSLKLLEWTRRTLKQEQRG